MRKIFYGLLVAVCVFTLTGCGEKQEKQVVETRDTSTMKKALLGHWVTVGEPENSDFYFSPSSIIMVGSDGTTIEQKYNILEYNEKENWIKTRTITNTGMLFDKRMQFNDSRTATTSVEITFVGGTPMPGFEIGKIVKGAPLKYVDAKQSPQP